MDPKLTYYGKVTDRVIIHRSGEMKEMILQHFAGKDIQITVERKKKRRSIMQNAYYWGVVVPIVQFGLNDAGYKAGKDQTHEFLKSMFAKDEMVNEHTGEILQTIASTTAMTTSRMMDYFADITRWAAEYLNVQIPEPNEQLNIEL